MSIVHYKDLSDEEKAQFDKTIAEVDAKEKAWFASWNFHGAEVMAARIAYQAFLEKETRHNPHNFYKAPLSRKSFMIGWLLKMRDKQ